VDRPLRRDDVAPRGCCLCPFQAILFRERPIPFAMIWTVGRWKP
jgi:hypothetical protein